MISSHYAQLLARGCSPGQAAQLAPQFASIVDGGRFGLFVPGRIELVGKHTDYAGGSSLTIATQTGFSFAAHGIPSRVMRIRCPSRSLEAVLPLESDLEADSWMGYPATVIRRVLANVPSAAGRGGVDVVFESSLPIAAGMSSSSAFMIGVFLAWAHAAGWIGDPLLQGAIGSDQDLADYLACVENGRDFGPLRGALGVGTAGGSQDHTAIIKGLPGRIQRFRYVGPRREGNWAWPQGLVPLVITSGVRAEKTAGARDSYNAASRLAASLLEAWVSMGGRPVAGLGHLTGDELSELEQHVSGAAQQRLRAFRTEMDAVSSASTALDAGDVTALAYALNASQLGAEALLQNQIPETSFLCRAAREAGALATTSFGAGFGGAVWALATEADADRVGAETLAAYHARHDARGEAFIEAPGPGAFFLDGRGLNEPLSFA